MLSFKQVLAFLNISESTLYRLMAKGEIIAYRVGGQWRFSQQELDTYLSEHTSVPTYA